MVNGNYIQSRRYITNHVHCMRVAHYVSPYHVTTKSSLSTSFLTACPSASETVGLPNDPRSNTGNWFKILVLRITYHLGNIKELIK